MTETTKSAAANDDIDLLLFLERVLRYFKKFRWVFIGAAIIGLAYGFYNYKNLSKIYSSSMIVHSFLLTNQELIKFTENWNSHLVRGEYVELARRFNCSESILPKVKKIKAEEIQKVFGQVNPHGFTIEVNVTDNAVLDELQKGIVYGFENNEYVKQRMDVKRDRLNLLIAQTEAEIKKLDSSKRIMESIITGKTKSVSPMILDASGTNSQLIELTEKNLAYKEELQFTNAIQVLQSFSKFRKPTNPKLIPWLVIGLMMFLSLAFIFTVYRTLSEKLKNRSTPAKK